MYIYIYIHKKDNPPTVPPSNCLPAAFLETRIRHFRSAPGCKMGILIPGKEPSRDETNDGLLA